MTRIRNGSPKTSTIKKYILRYSFNEYCHEATIKSLEYFMVYLKDENIIGHNKIAINVSGE